MAAPVLQNQNPAPSTTGIARSTTIYLEVVDTEFGVDAATVIITVDDTIVWTGDAQQTGYAVTKNAITDGFSYLITPAKLLRHILNVPVRVQADDNSANSADITYNFETLARPTQPKINLVAAIKNGDTTRGAGVVWEEDAQRWDTLEIFQHTMDCQGALFIDWENIWFGGSIYYSAGTPVISHWNWKTRTKTDRSAGFPGGTCNGMAALSPTEVYFAHYGNGSFARLVKWNGGSYSTVFTSPGNASYDRCVAFASDDLWAFGGYYTGSDWRGIASHWNGTAVTHYTTGEVWAVTNEVLADVVAFAPNDIYVIGDRLTRVYHWNGTAWSISSFTPGTGSQTAISGSSGSDLYVMKTGNNLYHYDGAVWGVNLTDATPPTYETKGMHARGSRLWVGGRDFTAGQHPMKAYDGAVWSTTLTQPRLISGNFGQVVQIMGVPATVSQKIQPEQVHGERKVEEEFIASQAGTEQFTLASDATPTTKQPSGYFVQVYVGGIEHEFNIAPGGRQFRVIDSLTVEVGGLVIGAEVEIVYGVA